MEKKLLIILCLVNLIGVFTPEIGFDALWYHLTLPKLFLLQHRWFYSGGLLYYSVMPRLAETLFIPALALLGTIGPKLIQYFAGIGSAYLTYKISRRFVNHHLSILTTLIFYGTWLVAWQSGSAYVDLIRTFFETLALYFILANKKIYSGIALGLAIGVKWHALGTLAIFSLVFTPLVIPAALFVALPWFLIANHFTQNPFYPLFEPFMTQTQLSQVNPDFFSLVEIIKRLFLAPFYLSWPIDDPLNPLLGILFLLGALYRFHHHHQQLSKLLIFSILGIVFWQLTPPPSSRYLLPFLPAIALVSVFAFKYQFSKILKLIFFFSIIGLICLRLFINIRNLNSDLSTKNLTSTIIDTDHFILQSIPQDSSVLVDVWHNLYYLPINFEHTSWADPNQKFDYLITKDQNPKAIHGELLHTNVIGAQVFKLND